MIQNVSMKAQWIFIHYVNVFQLAIVMGLPEYGDTIEPTHWMPLPVAPAKQA